MDTIRILLTPALEAEWRRVFKTMVTIAMSDDHSPETGVPLVDYMFVYMKHIVYSCGTECVRFYTHFDKSQAVLFLYYNAEKDTVAVFASSLALATQMKMIVGIDDDQTGSA